MSPPNQTCSISLLTIGSFWAIEILLWSSLKALGRLDVWGRVWQSRKTTMTNSRHTRSVRIHAGMVLRGGQPAALWPLGMSTACRIGTWWVLDRDVLQVIRTVPLPSTCTTRSSHQSSWTTLSFGISDARFRPVLSGTKIAGGRAACFLYSSERVLLSRWSQWLWEMTCLVSEIAPMLCWVIGGCEGSNMSGGVESGPPGDWERREADGVREQCWG